MKKKILWFASLLLLGVLSYATSEYSLAQAEQEIKGIQDGWAINDKCGVDFTEEVATHIVESGAKYVRINFRLSPLFPDWETAVEVTDTGDPCNRTALSLYDEIMVTVDRVDPDRQLTIIGLLSNESWHGSQSEWQANSAEREGGSGRNPYLEEFVQSADLLIDHFREDGRILIWEIWNEPNAYTGYDPETGYIGSSFIYPSNFAWLLRLVYPYCADAGVQCISGGVFGHDLVGLDVMIDGQRVTKKGNPVRPQYRVESQADSRDRRPIPDPAEPGLDDLSGATYLRDTYAAGSASAEWPEIKAEFGTNPMDGFGQHIYVDQNVTMGGTSESKILDYLSSLRGVYAHNRYEGKRTDKKTFLTEIGWATPNGPDQYGVQAQNLSTAYQASSSTSYVEAACWFQLRDNKSAGLYYGLFDADGRAKDSLTAFLEQ